ncbi:MAG TPA: carboxylesterase family protein [Rhizomicrobium sp.]|nr:carboxylesterase family protein [Rhizomicrobium sp.]
MKRRFCAAVLTAGLAVSISAGAAPLTRAQVEQGKLEGFARGGVAAYLGIPYAAPPVGSLRWRAPKSAPAWKGKRKAYAFGANCMQIITPHGHGPWTWEYSAQGKVSEDCLFVNVWTPATSTKDKLPVLFWIHGGGYFEGSSSAAIYDGDSFARKGIIVVSLNYRLGALGFLATPGLSAESPQHVSGNYGVLDTIAALKWVKKNIAAFGGDPKRVTIYGQSAGAGMVTTLTFIPQAKGLFEGAIAQSGVAANFPMQSMKQAEQSGIDFAASVGAPTLAKLRALPAEDLLKAPVPAGGPPMLRFMPIVDGWLLPGQPADLSAKGEINDTPFLTGQTANEASAMSPKWGDLTPEECDAAFARMTGAWAGRFKAAYLKPGEDCNTGLAQFQTDRGVFSAYQWIASRLKAGKGPVYAYLYSHLEPGSDAARYGVFHSSDIAYVFGTLDKTPERPFTGKDRAISNTISDYWVNFVKTGNPNGAGLPEWPAADPARPVVMETGDDFRAREPMSQEKWKLMEEFVAQGGTAGMF